MRIFLAFLFIHGFLNVLFGQRGVIHYTKENGLISNEVNDVAYDENGFLWIATSNGIDRFDGQRFIHFQHDPDDAKSICSNKVLQIVYDHKGKIWASTLNSGLIQISTKTLLVKNFVHTKNSKSISDNQSTAFEMDEKGNLWLSPKSRGLDCFDTKNNVFIHYKPSQQIAYLPARTLNRFSAIQQDYFFENNLWCASPLGLLRFDKQTKNWKLFQVRSSNLWEPVALNGNENDIASLEQDGKGNLYLGTRGGGLLYFDQYQSVFRKIQLPAFLARNGSVISAIKWRDTRYMYVCLENNEFLLFDTKTKEFIRYDEAERSIFHPINLARFGSQIAVCSRKDGLFIHNERLIYGQRKQTSGQLIDWAFKKGAQWNLKLYQSPENKIELLKGSQIKRSFLLPSHARLVQALPSDNDGFFVLSEEKLWHISLQGQLSELCDFHSASIFGADDFKAKSAFNDGDSLIWVGSADSGLCYYSFRTKSLRNYSEEASHRQQFDYIGNISSFARWKDVLYFGHDEGIGAIALRSKTYFQPSFSVSLPRDEVRSIQVDQAGNLWLGTLANGVLVVNIAQHILSDRITARMGLQTQQVDQIIIDEFGRAWIRNPLCISLIDRKGNAVESLETYNGMGGIRQMIRNGNDFYFLETNAFIQSTVQTVFPKSNEPKPYIQRVRELNDFPFQTNKKVFDYDNNNLAFEFGVLDFSNSTNNFVSYRLKGLEENWHSGNGKDEATYFHLPGGDYVFEVRIVEDGKMVTAQYPFSVIPPFWMQWWFVLLIAALLGVSVWLYIRVRIVRFESTERMKALFNSQINEMEAKALRAQMNPHFLFNSLNSIRLFILKNEVENASDYIAKFSKLLRMILNHSRQDMITVYDEIQSLKLYMDFERLRFDGGFEFDIQIDGQEVLGCQIPPMIIQPFVENAIWHGLMPRMDDKGYIKVSFQKKDSGLYVTVQDNGIGREKAKENNSKKSLKEGTVGLQITKDRLRSLTVRTKLMNDFEITDLYDEKNQPSGTLITLYFEIQVKQ